MDLFIYAYNTQSNSFLFILLYFFSHIYMNHNIACLNQSQKQVFMLLELQCQRRDSAFNLLEGHARDAVFGRLEEEDRKAREEIERQDVLKRSETDPNPVDVANVYPLKKNVFYLIFSVIFI